MLVLEFTATQSMRLLYASTFCPALFSPGRWCKDTKLLQQPRQNKAQETTSFHTARRKSEIFQKNLAFVSSMTELLQ